MVVDGHFKTQFSEEDAANTAASELLANFAGTLRKKRKRLAEASRSSFVSGYQRRIADALFELRLRRRVCWRDRRFSSRTFAKPRCDPPD
jgi:hypothetical protein